MVKSGFQGNRQRDVEGVACHKSCSHIHSLHQRCPPVKVKDCNHLEVNLAITHAHCARMVCPQSWYRYLCGWPKPCALVAEFFGTMFLTFILAFMASNGAGYHPGDFLIIMALAAFFGLLFLIETYKFFSGAHFNPSVTLFMLFRGKISCLSAICYILVQLLGGIIGALFVWLFVTGCHHSIPGCLGTPTVAPGISWWVALLGETAGVTLLCICVFFSVEHASMPSLSIAACLGVIHLVLLPVSGASVNFARYLGPFIFSHCWCWKWWIYLVSSIIGPIAAALYVWGCTSCGMYDTPQKKTKISDEVNV